MSKAGPSALLSENFADLPRIIITCAHKLRDLSEFHALVDAEINNFESLFICDMNFAALLSLFVYMLHSNNFYNVLDLLINTIQVVLKL